MFYVPVGPRGVLLRFGAFLIGVLGPIAYWSQALRRPLMTPLTLPLELPEA